MSMLRSLRKYIQLIVEESSVESENDESLEQARTDDQTDEMSTTAGIAGMILPLGATPSDKETRRS